MFRKNLGDDASWQVRIRNEDGQPEHPAVYHSGWKGGFLHEEAYQWVRPVELLGDEECLLPYAIGLDLNTAFLAAAAGARPRIVTCDQAIWPRSADV